MEDSAPGFVPRLLTDRAVGLFRADERVFEAMLADWRAQMLARGLTTRNDQEPPPTGGAFSDVFWRVPLAVATGGY